MISDLLREIASAKDVTNAIVLTHNIDFVFLQTVVLSAFRRCGQPTITILADAQCAAESFARQAPLLDGLGVRYRVVPIAMATGLRFHPKAVLLSTEEKATLFVGSGNLTFGGWRENAEIWTRYDTGVDGAAVFLEFQEYLERVLKLVPLSGPVRGELTEAFDRNTRKWIGDAEFATPLHLLGRVGDEPSILAQMMQRQATGAVDELVVCAPYFDDEGEALRALVEQGVPSRVILLCQPVGTTLTKRAFRGLEERVTLKHVGFEHSAKDGTKRGAFIHAKFYAFRQDDRVTVFAGSANCSRAGLLSGAGAGNAELMAVRQIPGADFESAFEGALTNVPEAPVLPDEVTDLPEPVSLSATIRLLAARLDSGDLRVAFRPEHAEIQQCELDGMVVGYSVIAPGVLSASCTHDTRKVRVRGLLNGVATWSESTWVDHEMQLRASARRRGLSDAIQNRVKHGQWNVQAWTEVMDVLCKHVAYTVTRAPEEQPPLKASLPTGGLGTFTLTDVFSSSYRVPDLTAGPFVALPGGKELALQHLLLRAFGMESPPSEEVTPAADEDGADAGEGDRPAALPPKAPEALKLTEGDRKRAQKVLRRAEEAMTADLYLAERPLEALAGDLKLASALLRTGLREDWVDDDWFYRATHRIWSALFLTGSPEITRGWLEYRFYHADDQAAFAGALRSPELAAALLGWAFTAAPSTPNPEAARFQLTVALSVARLPWLWDVGDDIAVASALRQLLEYTGGAGASESDVTRAWERTLKRGHALLRLEKAALGEPPVALRARVQASALSAGDLLWQGRAGYGVVAASTPRRAGLNVPVLLLQGPGEMKKFGGPFTLPLESLLDDRVLPASDEFGDAPRQVLRELVADLRAGFSAGVRQDVGLAVAD